MSSDIESSYECSHGEVLGGNCHVCRLEKKIEELEAEKKFDGKHHHAIYDKISMLIDGDTGWEYPGQLVRAVESVVKTRDWLKSRVEELEEREVWKPAEQVKEGDWIYGINMYVSRCFRVVVVAPSEEDFKVQISTEVEGDIQHSTVWNNTAVRFLTGSDRILFGPIEEVHEALRAQGLDPEKVGRDGAEFVKGLIEKRDQKRKQKDG